MEIYTNELDIKQFKKDFVTLYRNEDNEQVLDRIVELINESDCSIPYFLKKIDLIKGEEIQKLCRQAAIAQMYNVDLEDSGDSYVETSCYGEVVMIRLPISTGLIPKYSTVILSKYGDILINEGEISTDRVLNYRHGFYIQKIIDGQVSRKFGFIDNAGARVLPCIFDNIEGHEQEEFHYDSLHFRLWIYGNKDSIGRDKLQTMIKEYNAYAFNCLSEDSILFSLLLLRGRKSEKMEELKNELSSILISKEKLQEILESK